MCGAGERMPAARQPRAFLASDLDVFHDGLELTTAHRRSHLGRGVEPVADAQCPGSGDELFEKRLIDPLVYDDAACGGAALAARAEPAPEASFHRQLEVGVLHDHDDVLAAHLEMHLLERWRGLC